MTDQALHVTSQSATMTGSKKLYRRPELITLGSLRDITLSGSNSGANDGMPNMGTKRGGNF